MTTDKIEDDINFAKIIEHFKKNMKSILIITFLITSIATAYAYFLQPLYSSFVTLSFSNEKMSKLSSISSDDLSQHKKIKLETTKLTIKTRKFISMVIKDLALDKQYFIKNKLKKEELYSFQNLDVQVDIKDNFDSQSFQIKPIDAQHYQLNIEALNYEKILPFNTSINEKNFVILVQKKGKLQHDNYWVVANSSTLIVDKILTHLTVNILSENILQINYSDTVSRRAKEIVEAIGSKFIAYTLEKKTNEISQTLKFLDTQILDIKTNLEKEGNILKRYQKKSNAFMPLESSKLLMKTIYRKEQTLQELELQLTEVKEFKQALINNQLNTVSLLNSGINTHSIQTLIELFRNDSLQLKEMELQLNNIEKAITNNPELTTLIKEFNTKKKLLVNLKFNFTDGHPQVLQTQNDIIALEKEIRLYITTYINKLKDNRKSTKNKILNNIEVTQHSLNRKIKKLMKDVKEQKSNLQLLPEKDLTTQTLKRKFTLSENIYTFLLQKKMEFQISKASAITNTFILENARENFIPIKPNKKLIIIIGFIFGLAIGILFTIIRAMLDNKIHNASTVNNFTNIPLYGSLPNIANMRSFHETLRNVRTNLYFALRNKQHCTSILISSTVANEGKTTITAELAKIMADTNKKILAIDLDLRKPRLFQKMEKRNTFGITNYLTENSTIKELIQPVNKNLDFIAAGPVPYNPSELLMSDKFDELIKELKTQYDYILFDTAPIITVIDASLVLKHTDITLFIVKADVAETSYLQKFDKLRIEKDIKLSGIILNQVKEISNDYDYDYGDRYETV